MSLRPRLFIEPFQKIFTKSPFPLFPPVLSPPRYLGAYVSFICRMGRERPDWAMGRIASIIWASKHEGASIDRTTEAL